MAENPRIFLDQAPLVSGEKGGVPISPAQISVLGLVAAGLNTENITKRLGITKSTLRNHTDDIRKRLANSEELPRVSSTLQAVLIAARRGYIDVSHAIPNPDSTKIKSLNEEEKQILDRLTENDGAHSAYHEIAKALNGGGENNNPYTESVIKGHIIPDIKKKLGVSSKIQIALFYVAEKHVQETLASMADQDS